MGKQMKRRQFIALLGGTTLGWPLAVSAQQPAMPVIGFLHVAFPGPYTQHLVAFRQGLKQSGYVEGQNVAIEYRWANNETDRLPELAADLVRRQVASIVAAGGTNSALAANAATSTIPIVIAFGSDPVRLGLVASLNRPGGNVTGVTFLTTELLAKRLELLHELIPQATTVAYLGDLRIVVGQEMLRDTLAAASVLGLQIVVVEVRSDRDFESAFDFCRTPGRRDCCRSESAF
jgi:putative ABC transport system substrate-binding protein